MYQAFVINKCSRKYWNKLKECLKTEGSESVTNCHQLKLEGKTGNSVVSGENFLPPEKQMKRIKSGAVREVGDE